MNYYEIGQRIRRLRKAAGLSQEALAEKANISTVHMSHIETGNTKLSLGVLAALAAALKVRTDDLLYGETEAGKNGDLEEIARLLEGCTARQTRILRDILVAARATLDRNL